MQQTTWFSMGRGDMRKVIAALVVAASIGWNTAVHANALTKVEVSPPDINLNTSRDRQSFIVQATYADGITRDVTAEAKVSFANPAFVKLDKNVIHPVADGATQMKVEFGGQTLTIPVNVKDATKDRPISFKLDVMPVFA